MFLGQLLFCQQKMDFSRVVAPYGQTPKAFEDYLVQLAWFNSPENLVYKEKIDIASNNAKISKWEWLDDVSVTFNFNEGNIGGVDDGNIFFPRYNLGLALSPAAILARPNQSKIAQKEVLITELEEQQKMLEVRAEVLRRYEAYELAVEVLKLKTQAAEEAGNIYQLVSNQFEDGKVNFKDFTDASGFYHGANEEKAIAKSQLNTSIIALEELIGIPWEKALARKKKERNKKRN